MLTSLAAHHVASAKVLCAQLHAASHTFRHALSTRVHLASELKVDASQARAFLSMHRQTLNHFGDDVAERARLDRCVERRGTRVAVHWVTAPDDGVSMGRGADGTDERWKQRRRL
jgi:hypothetical protein